MIEVLLWEELLTVNLRIIKYCYCCSVTESCPPFETPKTAACQDPLSFTISWILLKLMPTESVMPSNHLIFCCTLLLPRMHVHKTKIRYDQMKFIFEYLLLLSFKIRIHVIIKCTVVVPPN